MLKDVGTLPLPYGFIFIEVLLSSFNDKVLYTQLLQNVDCFFKLSASRPLCPLLRYGVKGSLVLSILSKHESRYSDFLCILNRIGLLSFLKVSACRHSSLLILNFRQISIFDCELPSLYKFTTIFIDRTLLDFCLPWGQQCIILFFLPRAHVRLLLLLKIIYYLTSKILSSRWVLINQ